MKTLLALSALLVLLLAAPAWAVQATLTWNDPVDPNRTSIRVDRQDAGAGAFVQQGSLLAPSAATFNQPGLAIGTQYCYKVTPVGGLGDGPSLSACGTPNVPIGLTPGLTIIFQP